MLCDHLEGWHRECGRETQEGGDMGIYVYVKLIQFVIKQKHTIVKQLYSNKDVKKKLVRMIFYRKHEMRYLSFWNVIWVP